MSRLASTLSAWGQAALDFVFPAECSYCHEFLGDRRAAIFCEVCWDSIPLLPQPGCAQCGKPFLAPASIRPLSRFRCGACRKHVPSFDRAITPAHYEGVMKDAIHQFKFAQKTSLAKPLAQLMIRHLPADIHPEQFQAVLPVPLYKTRQRQRGYNQSALLAAQLARQYHIPLMRTNLIRIRSTHAQALLKGRKARQENVKNAFSVRIPEQVRGKRVIVVDDVMTTGATLNECAKVLKRAGASYVCVMTLSRAGLRQFHSPDQHVALDGSRWF